MKVNRDIAIFPGTFEIFHEGHIHILEKGLKLFKKIYIVVSNNENKISSDLDIRYQNVLCFIKKNNYSDVEVIKNEGYTTDILKNLNCYYIIRGIRDIKDYNYEMRLYQKYKKVYNNCELIIFFSDDLYKDFSSNSILRSKNNEK